MPSYKVHLVGGVATYTILYGLLPLVIPTIPTGLRYYVMWLGFALLGSIFPDIDVYSKMQQVLFRSLLVLLPCMLYLRYLKAFIGLGIVTGLCVCIRHRTITHHIGFLFACAVAGSLLVIQQNPHLTLAAAVCGIQFFFGAVSHVVLDIGLKKALFIRK